MILKGSPFVTSSWVCPVLLSVILPEVYPFVCDGGRTVGWMEKFRALRCDVMLRGVVFRGVRLCDVKGFFPLSHHHRSVLFTFLSHYQKSIFSSVTEVGLLVGWVGTGRCGVMLRGVV